MVHSCVLDLKFPTRTSKCKYCEMLCLVLDICHRFFARVDRVLRRSLGVSEHAKTDSTVKPAPPVDPSPPEVDPSPKPVEIDASGRGKISMEDMLGDAMQKQFQIEMEEIDDDDPIHDEL